MPVGRGRVGRRGALVLEIYHLYAAVRSVMNLLRTYAYSLYRRQCNMWKHLLQTQQGGAVSAVLGVLSDT